MEQDAYLQSLLPSSTGPLADMEAYAAEKNIPIMEQAGIYFLMQLIRMHRPERILEIGTAIGYSALRMLEASPKSKVVSIERDENRFRDAQHFVHKQGAEDKIQLLFGDALDLKEDVQKEGSFDFLFIDAAKGKYEEFFHLYEPLLNEGAVIVSDNVLFKGYVADDSHADKRMAKIARKIRDFNNWLVQHPDYHTTIVPIGDGVAITIKK
ncbi:Predicted O-methyltransferase YrrM [Halobacillus alkaliphilus]|uniref:tRNA 5-hydroxyuridine methyltransferase n=1 Tax=Halobacillus alkaliphilus TaxID=396056 RepID=A0A1I2JIJ9_9BACI|nr:O-methyltransferase [Halobacillus alkaliphilus]SFF52987.1 Predicted O-methyltransferase YrrM [Halobacillus alkaliphilus]